MPWRRACPGGHSRTLAWRIPWTEEPGGLPVHGVAQSWTWLSNNYLVPWQGGNSGKGVQRVWPSSAGSPWSPPWVTLTLLPGWCFCRLPLLQLHWHRAHASSYLEVVSSQSLDHDGPHSALPESPLLPGGLQEQAKADSPSCLAPTWSASTHASLPGGSWALKSLWVCLRWGGWSVLLAHPQSWVLACNSGFSGGGERRCAKVL